MGPRRIALGFYPDLSAPMERKILDLKNEDCEHPQIAWREWGRWPGRGRRSPPPRVRCRNRTEVDRQDLSSGEIQITPCGNSREGGARIPPGLRVRPSRGSPRLGWW